MATALFPFRGMAQNTVVINQSGGAGNSAVVSQSGQGGSVIISQSGASSTDSSGAPVGNHASLYVTKGTQTTVTQHSTGSNAVAISQDGQTTAVISQSSDTGENSIITLPEPKQSGGKPKATKRRNRQQ